MPKRDRKMLTKAIAAIVDELSDPSRRDAEAAADPGTIGARLDPLLDAYLLESQQIVGADVTILLADIRGFTALTAAHPPELVIALLNRFFSVMCDCVERHGGVVDKFIGDSVMALFGAPKARADDLTRALACAAEMQQAMAVLNHEGQARGEPSLYVGIAVNTGRVMVGSFGPPSHSEYTAIGEPVNLVARIESFSLRGQVLLSEASHAAARDIVEIGSINQVRVKGLPAPLTLYELRSVRAPHRVVVPQVEVRRSPRIAVDLDAMFRLIENDCIVPDGFPGRVRELGYHGLRADLPFDLPAYAELAINLRPDLGLDGAQDLYARVLRARRCRDVFRTSMELTAIDSPGHRQVKDFVDNLLWRG